MQLNFNTPESWIVLSPIELSIKRKIEKMGTPLKNWDIQIYRGVLTGCNEAFIISTEKKEEILSNCRTEEERKRTDELIRPILRGRDIRKYAHSWAGLFLIATFPSRQYDIEQYPAVKDYLLSYGKKRLEQSGNEYTINGIKIKSRKKTNNKWFETQDSISYWEEFSKPKIIYPETTMGANFAIDSQGYLVDKTAFILISKFPKYLQSVLSSKLFEVAYKKIYSSVGLGLKGYQYNEHALLKLPVLLPSEDRYVSEKEIYETYKISEEEKKFIEAL